MEDPVPRLTPRERDVLDELCRPVITGDAFTEPASIRTIATALFITEAAVKQHLLHLYDKFEIYEDGQRRRIRLANEALRRGVVSIGGEVPGPDVAATDLIAQGRQLLADHAWEQAFDVMTAADAAGALDAGGLEVLGEAAVWSDHHDAAIAARVRAHAAFVGAGDRRSAARVAIALVPNHITRTNMAAAEGWFNKARRLLEGESESVEHGELAAMTALIQVANGLSEEGLASASTALRIGQEHGDSDLVALGLVFQGYALSRLGRLDEGRALLDEAMASAAAGELKPFTTAIVYCRTICTCLDLFDFRRAAEWTELIQGLTDRDGPVGMAGDCRTHRVAIKIFRGEWRDGEREAERACSESATWDLNHTAIAQYELGDIRRRTGDLDGADEAFRRAHELGGNPHPGLALLQAARGDTEAAAAGIASALVATRDPLSRAKLLPAQVEIAAALGDVDTARNGAIELDGIAERYGSGALRAAADCARGAVRSLDGDAQATVRDLRDGLTKWQAAGAPYESARTRAHLADALLTIDDRGSALMELDAALSTFRELGATPEADRVAATVERLRSGETN